MKVGSEPAIGKRERVEVVADGIEEGKYNGTRKIHDSRDVSSYSC